MVAEGKEDENLGKCQVYATEVENLNPFDAIKMSAERLIQLQTCTSRDPVLMTLKTTYSHHRMARANKVSAYACEYWLHRDEIGEHNRVLFKNHRVIFPKLLRAEILSRIHSSHFDAEFCLGKARDVVFWPGMSNAIKESITNCQICADFQACNPR